MMPATASADPFPLAAALIRDRVLVRGTSLRHGRERLWREPLVGALLDRISAATRDAEGGSVHARWDAALAGAPPPLVQLAVEALAIHLLIAADITEATKRALLASTASHGEEARPRLHKIIDAALAQGRTPTGVAFKRRRLSQVAFVLAVARAWWQLPAPTRRDALQSAGAFRAWLWELPVDGAQAQREALLHLVHPARFEPIVSRTAKERIVAALADDAEQDLDTDAALAAIRLRWTPQLGPNFAFGDPPLRARWLD
jgi:5-methylcytosine-specific restriction enzyme B